MALPMFYNNADEWSQAVLLYDAALKEFNTKLEILNNEFKLTHRYNPIEHITSRIKSPQSIAKKIRHKGLELTTENIVKYLNDVAGIRVICSFTSDIYKIAELIANQSDVKVLKVKDYIKHPKNNGYMSYHMIVSVPIFLSDNVIETKVEIQIRTIAMDFWASLEHKIYYKFEGNAPERIRTQLKECADIVSYLDKKMLSINNEVQSFQHEEDEIQEIQAYQSVMKDSYGRIYSDVEDEEAVDEEKEEEGIVEEGNIIYMSELDKSDEISMVNRMEKVVYEQDKSILEKQTEDIAQDTEGSLVAEKPFEEKTGKSMREGITSFFFRKRDNKATESNIVANE